MLVLDSNDSSGGHKVVRFTKTNPQVSLKMLQSVTIQTNLSTRQDGSSIKTKYNSYKMYIIKDQICSNIYK